MKTTIEIADPLLERVRRVAADRETTLTAIVDHALRCYLEEPEAAEFRLRDASVGGSGLQLGIDDGDWSLIRALVYEGHGG
jgi:Arc/MetJ family transcription regulator